MDIDKTKLTEYTTHTTTSLLYIILETAIKASSLNREVNDSTTSNIVATTMNRHLCVQE